MAQRFLYLVRHGQYNQAEGDEGRLTETGILQSQYAAEALRRLRFNAMYASPLPRAHQTAEIIADTCEIHLPLQLCDSLQECVPSVPPILKAYYRLNKESNPPRPHEVADCQRQLHDAFERFAVAPAADADQVDLLVCHGNVIRFFVTQALEVSVDTWMKMGIYNCGITCIFIQPSGSISLLSHNEAGHLPLDLRTNN